MNSSRDKAWYGLLVDVGSGSIGFAVVESNQKEHLPKLIWTHREHVAIKNIDTINESGKSLITTLTDMALMVTAEGFKALQEHTGSSRTKISEVQVTIAAPWTYTVSRNVTFEQTEPFKVTDTLVGDLALAAGEESMQKFTESYSEVLKDVTETSRGVLDTYANGYRLPIINDQETTTLTLTHVTTLVYNSLYVALQELNDKVFSGVSLNVTSSMLGYYYATRHLKPHVYDVCLVDVTDEATEIGIVRNGSLTYCTHIPFGSISIAREIAESTKRPLGEIVSRLSDFVSDKDTKDISEIMDNYTEKVANLFKETGDALSIPKTIYLLSDSNILPLLKPVISTAGKHASKTTPILISIPELLHRENSSGVEYALDTAARFFHTNQNREHFEYL